MPRRNTTPAFKPGSVTRLCPLSCGRRIQPSQAACSPCWKILPPPLRARWLAAKDGDCNAVGELERVQAAIADWARGRSGASHA